MSGGEKDQPSAVVRETIRDLIRFRRKLLRALRTTDADLRELGHDVSRLRLVEAERAS